MRASSVLLFRHGQAVSVGSVASDEERYLTEDGRGVVKLAGRALRDLGVAPGAILASPLVRADETAHILRTELAFPGAVVSCRELEPSAHPILALELLREQTVGSVLVVGHLPLLERLGVLLLSGLERGDPFLRMHVAGAACLAFPEGVDAGRGVLEWLLTPEQLIRCAVRG